MGNITNRTSNHQLNLNDTRLENRLFSTSSAPQNVVNLRKSSSYSSKLPISSTIKMVLPDPESRQKLRQTYNGEILQAGGTLTGRQIPNIKNLNRRHSSSSSSSSSINQKFPDKNQNNNELLKSSQTKNLLYKSEPDLRNYNTNNNDLIISNNKFKKKYKAPAPPPSSNNYSNQKEENNDLSNRHENTEELPLLRRARLFKTRVESKKNSNNSSQYPIIIINNDDQKIEENSASFIEDKILPNENLLNFSRPKYNSNNNNNKHVDGINLPQKIFSSELLLSEEIEQRSRDEPSGKESSIPELSPSDRKNSNNNKPNKVFYFGMENNHQNSNNNDDFDLSSNNNNNNNNNNCYNNNTEDDFNILIEDSSSSGNINLNLRPVLPRKRLEITHFSPITAWRQLDAGLEENYQNNHFDNSSRTYFWTPEQDLETNHSLDDLRKIDFSSDGYLNINRNKNNNHFNKHRAHVFSLSLPRDLTVQSSTINGTINNNNNKNGLNSLKTFKRSVSDMINNLSFKKGNNARINNNNNNNEHHEDDPNWFLSRSAPNSINGNSFESSDFPFMNNNQISSPRLMYLPDNNYSFNDVDDNNCIGSSIYSKSCEDLQDFQPHHKLMENNKTVRRTISSKKKKFTFQSTIRQIERRRMAEKLSKEAQEKEKQRLREMEIMKRVEEEFQRKRDKEKANIRHQLRLYAMEEDQYISLPNVELNSLKLEEREEPDGASSPTIPNKIKNLTTTQELSEYRQMQRNYKEYRSCPKFSPEFKPTTVHREITCKIPNIQDRKKYRSDNLGGKIMRRSKSIDSVLTKF